MPAHPKACTDLKNMLFRSAPALRQVIRNHIPTAVHFVSSNRSFSYRCLTLLGSPSHILSRFPDSQINVPLLLLANGHAMDFLKIRSLFTVTGSFGIPTQFPFQDNCPALNMTI